MNCPECGNAIPFKKQLFSFSPFRYACGACLAELRLHAKSAFPLLAVVVISGILIAAEAVIMEWKGVWNGRDSLVFFLIAVPLYTVYLSFLQHRYGVLVSARKNDGVNEATL